MAVFPELRKGDTTPESGSTPSTPELISSISKAMRLDSPSARKKPKWVVGPLRHAKSARHQKPGQQQHGGDTREAPLFADSRQHQVGIARRDHFRIAPARARAPRSAGGKGPQRMGQLVAAVDLVIPRREPHVDALHDGARLADAIAHEDRHHHQHHARPSPARDVRAPRRTSQGTRKR